MKNTVFLAACAATEKHGTYDHSRLVVILCFEVQLKGMVINMKKIFALLLAFLLAMTLAACSFGAPKTEESSGLILIEDGEQTAPAEEQTALPDTPAAPDTPAPPDTPAAPDTPAPSDTPAAPAEEKKLAEDGSYNSAEEVALYIHQYGHLPGNYITKKEAEALGWSGGSLEPYAPGKSIGGSRFGNYEGILPTKDGRKYTECDIGTAGKKSRGAKRIVFSNDGLIYYTEDHYETFTLLYGEAEK